MPDNERMVCLRLGNVRKVAQVSRAALAREMKIEPARLAAYEMVRVVVPYEIGRDFCQRFNLNQRWFATGLNPSRTYFPVDPKIEAEIIGRKPFSEMYERHLKAMVERRHADWKARRARGEELPVNAGGRDGGPKLGQSEVDYAMDILVSEITMLMGDLSLEASRVYFKEMLDRSHALIMLLGKSDPGLAEFHLGVDTLKEIKDNVRVRLTWSRLKQRLIAATEPSGKRAELARAIGVKDANINSWLVRDVEPGAGATFRLLEWVTAEEAKQRSADTTSIMSAPKAQMKQDNANHHTSESSGREKASPGKPTKASSRKRTK